MKFLRQVAKACAWESGDRFSSVSTTGLRADGEPHLVSLSLGVFMVTMTMTMVMAMAMTADAHTWCRGLSQ